MRIRLGAIAAFLAVLSVVHAAAQTTSVKGSVKDQNGPVVGAQVQLKDVDTGRKYTLKTDKKGQYFSIGIAPAAFEVTVTKDGKLLYTTKFRATFNEDTNVMDIDLTPSGPAQAAPPPQAAAPKQEQPKLTEEQKKQIEEIQKKNAEVEKENAKIGNLNTMLKQAQADMQANNFAAAVPIMEQAAQQDNNQHDQVLGVLGDAYLGAKQYPEAAEAYNKAIQIGSASTRPNAKQMLASYYNNLGQAYARTGKTTEAVDAYHKAAEQDPTRAAQFYYNEGAVLTNQGKTDDANTAFTKAIQADPNKADAYYQRAINSLQKATVDKSGKMIAPPGTADDFNKYLELAPTGANADAAKQMLDTLGAKITTGFKKK